MSVLAGWDLGQFVAFVVKIIGNLCDVRYLRDILFDDCDVMRVNFQAISIAITS